MRPIPRPRLAAWRVATLPSILTPAHAADTLFEFYNTNLVHYFLTIDPAEAAAIDSGAAGPGWQRTNKNIGAYRDAESAHRRAGGLPLLWQPGERRTEQPSRWRRSSADRRSMPLEIGRIGLEHQEYWLRRTPGPTPVSA